MTKSKRYKNPYKINKRGSLPKYGLGGDIFSGTISGVSAGAATGNPFIMAGLGLAGAVTGWAKGKQEKKAIEAAEQAQLEASTRQSRLSSLVPQQQYATPIRYPDGGEVLFDNMNINGNLPLVQDPLELASYLNRVSTGQIKGIRRGEPMAIEAGSDVEKKIREMYEYPFTSYTNLTNEQGEEYPFPVLESKQHKELLKEKGQVAKTVTYPMGGLIPYGPNAELEGGESFETPQGENFNVQGPGHSEGGVPLNLEEGTRVYSDRLIVPGTDETFSDSNKKLAKSIDKYQEILNSPNATSIQRKTAERMLNKTEAKQHDLFVTQERLKNKKGIKKESLKFEFGGVKGNYNFDPYQSLLKYRMPGLSAQIVPEGVGSGGLDIDYSDYDLPDFESDNSVQSLGGAGSSKFSETATGITSLAPALYNLGQGLFGKAEQEDPSDYYNSAGMAAAARLRDRKYNTRPQIDAVRRAAATGKRNLTAVSGSKGELLGNLRALSAATGAQEAQVLAAGQNIENQYQSEAAQMLGQVGAQQSAAAMTVAERNSANRAAHRGFLGTGLSQLSNIAQVAEQRKGLEAADKMRINALNDLLPNFVIDPNTGRIKYKPN